MGNVCRKIKEISLRISRWRRLGWVATKKCREKTFVFSLHLLRSWDGISLQ